MPELPEVEVVARTIQPEIIGKEIEDVDVFWARIINFPDDQEELKLKLIGEKIGKVRRTGKYLRIEIGQFQELVVHFRMTGKFKMMLPEQRHQKHVHFFLHFKGEKEGLAYHDVRKFGDIFLVPKGDYRQIKGLFHAGPDPLDPSFSYEQFEALILTRKRQIKALLLDQSVITGLGNYLCDEMLWFPEQKGIHPETLSNSLSKSTLNVLYKRMLEVINKSIQSGGNSFRNFSYGDGMQGEFKALLKVYGRQNEACHNCGNMIEKIKVAGRSSHYCPQCQQNL